MQASQRTMDERQSAMELIEVIARHEGQELTADELRKEAAKLTAATGKGLRYRGYDVQRDTITDEEREKYSKGKWLYWVADPNGGGRGC